MQHGSTFLASLLSPDHSSSAMEGLVSIPGWRGSSFVTGSSGPAVLRALFPGKLHVCLITLLSLWLWLVRVGGSGEGGKLLPKSSEPLVLPFICSKRLSPLWLTLPWYSIYVSCAGLYCSRPRVLGLCF